MALPISPVSHHADKRAGDFDEERLEVGGVGELDDLADAGRGGLALVGGSVLQGVLVDGQQRLDAL